MKNIKSFEKLNEASTIPKDVQSITADWKDMEGMVKQIKSALKKFGINVYDDPLAKGSDTYSFYLTKEKLSKAQLDELSQ